MALQRYLKQQWLDDEYEERLLRKRVNHALLGGLDASCGPLFPDGVVPFSMALVCACFLRSACGSPASHRFEQHLTNYPVAEAVLSQLLLVTL